MKKIKSLITLGAASILLVGCVSNASKDESKKPDSSKDNTSQVDSSAASSKQGGSSAASSSASSASTSSSAREVPSTVSVTKKDKPYHIFDKVPEIKFTFDGTDTSWATTPGRTSEKPEQAGYITTSSVDGKKGLENAPAGMKVRGNYTAEYQKKPFRIKFDSKQNLFGLNESQKYKKWVLLADVKDSSLLRNASAFYLASQIMPNSVFTSDFTPVHVYINDEYWGMYLLAEQKEVKEGRVPVYEAGKNDKGTDIGYFFELDNYYTEEQQKADGDPTFEVEYKPSAINWHHPFENFTRIQRGYTMGSDLTNPDVQLPYLTKRVEMAYTVIYDAVLNNKFQRIENETLVDDDSATLEECLAKTIDIDSFVSMYLLNEVVCNPDVGYSSFYMSLDMSASGNKLLTCNCPWDFDSTMGVRQSGDRSSAEGVSFSRDAQGYYASRSSNMWLSIIAKAQFFKDKVKNLWNQLKEEGVFAKVAAMQDDYSTTYVDDYAKNFTRWPRTMGNNPEVSHETVSDVNSFRTEAEAKTFMQNWYNKRVNTVDGLFNGTGGGGEEFPDKDEFKANANKVRLEGEDAQLTNGSGSNTIVVKENDEEDISNHEYIGNMDGNNGASCTWTLNNSATTAKQVYIVAGLSARTTARTFADMFRLTINGQSVTPETITIPAGSGRDYHMWTTVDVGFSSITPGNNTIVLTSTGSCTNFDYLDFYIAK